MHPRFGALVLALLAGAGAACGKSSVTTPDVPVAKTPADSAIDAKSTAPLSLAVIGDTPYGPDKMAEFPRLVALIDADGAVGLVAHLGDIKAGGAAGCTDAYYASVRALFDGFDDPFVYTPGDNEWSDCHGAAGSAGFYKPSERLQAIRTLFFPAPGRTLGGRRKPVLTQGGDARNAAYVENVMWMESKVVFATLNVPGSNNGLAPWGAVPTDAASNAFPTQAEEYAARAQANADWVARTFATAAANDASGVVLMLQADMWAGGVAAAASLTGYDALVRQIGTLASAFARPVMLLEGDSHTFRTDAPYAAASPLRLVHPSTPAAENVTRMVVEGSSGRTEYVRFTVDPRGGSLFAWQRVPLP